MLEWLATLDNATLATPISQGMMAALSKCIPQGSTSSRAKRERMWGKFYHTRTLTEFKELWICLMQLSIGKSAFPIFYQYITDVLFKTMIKCHFPVHPVATQAHDVPPLGYQESNALCAMQLAVSHEPSENVSKEDLIHSRRNLCCAMLNCDAV